MAGGDVTVSLTNDYLHTNSGELQADGNLTFSTTGNITNQAQLLAGNNMILNAGSINNRNAIYANNDLTLNATDIENAVTADIAGLNTYINAVGTLTNRGLIDGSDTFISAGTLNNIGTGSLFGDHLAINVATLNNHAEVVNLINSSAVIAARTRLDIGVQTVSNKDNSLLFSAGDMAIGGALDATQQATTGIGQPQTYTLINHGATIEALGSLKVNAANIQNSNANITTQLVVDSTQLIQEVQPEGWSQRYDVSRFPTIFNYGIEAQRFVNELGQVIAYFEDYSFFNYTETTSSTHLLSSQPAQLLSGGDMQLIGNVTNSDSKIIAGGALEVSGATLNNVNTQGQVIKSYSGWVQFRDWDGDDEELEFGRQNPFNPASNVTTYNLSTSEVLTYTDPGSVGAASGTTVSTLNTSTLPTNSLFTPTANPTSTYLVETNPRFANYRTWLSSDYMLNQLSYDPATTTKRLGDGFYEQKLIREQVSTLTGKRFLEGYASDEAQYQALMVNGVTFARAFNLTPGIALTDLQMAKLTSDIVWLVEQTVTLPDGSTVQALVPKVYAKLKDGDINNAGALLAGNSVNLNLTGDLNNGGTIGSRTLLAINADNINNLGGNISANDVLLTARRDINNVGGTVVAQNSLGLDAARDINVISTTQSSQNNTGQSTFTRTNLDRIAGLYVTGGAGLMVASAGNDFHLDAAQLINSATNPASQTILKAGNNLTLGTVEIAEQNNSIETTKRFNKSGSTEEIGTQIQTQGDNTLFAGNDLNIKAAAITSQTGDLQGIAGGDITIEEGRATDNTSVGQHKKKSSGFSSKTSTRIDSFESDTSIGSTLSAESITLVAGAQIAQDGSVSTQQGVGQLNIQGSSVVATNDVKLNAGSDINITSSQDTFNESHYSKVKKSGLSASGASVTLGNSQLTNTNDSQQVTNLASTVGSIEGNVNINSGKTYNQTGSDVLTPKGDIDIAAQQVNITAATDTYNSQQTMKYKQSGITLAISNPVISAIQTTQQMSEAANKTDDPRLQALAAGTAALAVKNAFDALPDQYGNVPTAGNTGTNDMSNVREANAADQVGGINLSLSFGTAKSSSKTTQTSTAAASSHVTAGGDVNINATGAGQNSDINVMGSQVKAADDVTLKAEDQINLIAAQNVDTLKSKNSSSSASIGVSVGTDGLLFTASASGSKGKAKGNGATWTETVIQSGIDVNDKVILESGTDTNLIGAQVVGNLVIANIGTTGMGNLNIQSLQDTNDYNSKQQSIGGSVSVGAGRWGGSLNMSNSKIKSNYASVNEQAGILAGDGGFQVNVASNTNLTGAVVASTDKAIQENANRLTTQKITTSNIQNNTEYSAKGISLGAGVNVGLTENNRPVAGVTKSIGWGSLSNDANSVTLSGISGGNVSITDTTSRMTILNRDVKAQFVNDTQGNITATAVDSQGNNLAQTINPIFNAEKVQEELNAQIQITQAFDKAQQQFRLEINRKVDKTKAEKEAVAEMLQNPDLSDDQRTVLIARGLYAQREIEQLENMGLAFSVLTASLSAPTSSFGGMLTSSLAPQAANQIGQYFKDHGTEGSGPHIFAHGILAGAVAAMGGNNPMGAALSAMGGEMIAPLVADLLYGKPSEALNAEQKATVSAIANLGGIAVGTGVDSSVNNIAQSNLSAQNAVDNNWGKVGHYSTMATVLYLAGFSPKDAKAIALAAWGPDTDKRNAMSSNSVMGSLSAINNSQSIHLLDGVNDPAKVIASQQKLAEEIAVILLTIKQYENDPVQKAAYLTTPSVQNTLHAFGDAFAHVEKDGTHYPAGQGHAGDGTEPDNPQTHPDAYRNYVNSIFYVASKVTGTPRVSSDAITNLANKVIQTGELGQENALKSNIGSVSQLESWKLVHSPVDDCGYAGDCFSKKVGSQVNPQINNIYGIKR